jgi:hypothetical protein
VLETPAVNHLSERGAVMGTDRDDLLPGGPGRHERPTACPPFDADPAAWLGWLEATMSAGERIDEAARAAAWADPRGNVWRVVVTPDGPEVRPAFGAPFGGSHDLPMVCAILVAPPVLHVELGWRTGREVARVGVDEVSVLDLGLAMLTATELPHESVARVGPDTWRRARERWRDLARRSRTQVG